MEIIITLIIIYFVGCFFEKSDYQRMRDIEKLPKFTREDAIDYWVFSSYKNENDYENNQPFFEEGFTDFNKMKTFSAEHSHLNKKVYPDYCSNYKKINSLNKQD